MARRQTHLVTVLSFLTPLSLLAIALLGCGDQRTRPVISAPAYTYVDDIQSLLQDKCVGCHAATQADGSYALDSWRGLLGAGTDVQRNARPGDAQSKLLLAVGSDANATHQDLLSAAQLATLTEWVVEDRMAYFRSGAHPPGWLDPTDRDALTFHGGELRFEAWDTSACEGCHGQDLDGGLSQRGCQSCHSAGPLEGCNTCHGTDVKTGLPPPDLSWNLDPAGGLGRGGVHAPHAAQGGLPPVACSECHVVPETVDAPGHLFDEGKRSDLRAEVTFGSRASLGGVKATYDPNTKTCTVYCHGTGLADQGSNPKPAWDAPDSVTCGSCHPVPMAGVGGADCTTCHQQSVAACTPGSSADCLATDGDQVGIRFLDPALHIDGKAPVGKLEGAGTCYGCHGTEASDGAPAPDLHGRTEVSEVTVGLHARHVRGGGFSKAIPCNTCHRVPITLLATGHIDSALPAEVTFGPLATGTLRDPSTDREPTWDRTTANCSNVYCHSLNGGSVGQDWDWTQTGPPTLGCVSCHGCPPARTITGRSHPPNTDCQLCHDAAYQANGALDPDKHINGKVDL